MRVSNFRYYKYREAGPIRINDCPDAEECKQTRGGIDPRTRPVQKARTIGSPGSGFSGTLVRNLRR